MLCGESEESLKEGREVAAVVTFAGSHDVLVRLPDFGDAEGVLTRVARDDHHGQPRDHFVRDQPIRVRWAAQDPPCVHRMYLCTSIRSQQCLSSQSLSDSRGLLSITRRAPEQAVAMPVLKRQVCCWSTDRALPVWHLCLVYLGRAKGCPACDKAISKPIAEPLVILLFTVI